MRWFSTFEEFATVRTAGLVRQARLILHDDHQADDVVSEVLARVWSRWSRVTRADSPDAYVRRMLVNECTTQIRKTSSRREFVVEPTALPERAQADPSAAVDLRDQLVLGLSGLPAQQRIALVLRYLEHLEYVEIASAMGIREGTARFHVSSGLARLRRELGETDEVTR